MFLLCSRVYSFLSPETPNCIFLTLRPPAHHQAWGQYRGRSSYFCVIFLITLSNKHTRSSAKCNIPQEGLVQKLEFGQSKIFFSLFISFKMFRVKSNFSTLHYSLLKEHIQIIPPVIAVSNLTEVFMDFM